MGRDWKRTELRLRYRASPLPDIPADKTKGWLLATLLAWTIFTFVLWVGSLKHNKALISVFTTLLILFGLLDVAVWTGNARITHIAGWEGIFCALTAWYLMAAIVINDSYGKTVLPIGPIHKIQEVGRAASR